ncbi:hypothetical protein IV203_034958 [Nitzschia inconspicua]|uniref:Uncharacterized protein n=1 Tax=Nitzschia inconspicua TaxID=303405 RepID=A0A9K3PU39_9STRA|nr:hypothetical protein IV203_034958 [Nitzschia inconspicua]
MGPLPGRLRARPKQEGTTISLPHHGHTVELLSVRTPPMTSIKRRRQRQRHKFHGFVCGYDHLNATTPLFLCCILGVLLFIGFLFQYVLSIFFSVFSSSFERQYTASFGLIDRYATLYKETYRLAMERKLPPDQTTWPTVPSRSFELNTSYGGHIKNCSLTILVMDDVLGRPIFDYGNGQSIWFVLESIGAFAPPDACISLVTSDCAIKQYFGTDGGEDTIYDEIVHGIYKQSLPLFRKRIESGRVRLSLTNHEKYHIFQCTDYSSSNHALMHRSFWVDEFDGERDSDQVLVMDRNAALCYPMITLPDFAFVGSVWAQAHNPLLPDFLEGPCREMTKSWHSWLRPQRKYLKERQWDSPEQQQQPIIEEVSLLREKFPAMCEGGRAPVGGGGMSIRSRKWMIRAIETCPHVLYSGVDVERRFVPCKVFDPVNEDYYFATILQGIDAPLPSAYTATLYFAEVYWPDEIAEIYPPANPEEEKLAADRPKITSIDGTLDLLTPNGVHNVWWYHPEEMLRSQVMAESCPFLPFIYDSTMNRHDEFTKESEWWIGIGT